MSRTADTARRTLARTHIVARDIDATLRALHDHRGGYPATVPGAAPSTAPTPPAPTGMCLEPSPTDDHTVCGNDRPCPDHDTPVHLTSPEKATLSIDRAALDLRRLNRYIDQADAAIAKALAIIERNRPAITDTKVAKALAADERSLWCHNCATHGVNEVREEGRHSCQFCRKFKATWGTYPPLGILEIHARRTVSNQDAVRILDRDCPGWRKTMPKPKAPKMKTTPPSRSSAA